MHLSVSTPGFWVEGVYSALPPSLSPMVTVPAANELPGFDVVDENAPKVASIPAVTATRANAPRVRPAFLKMDTVLLFLVPRWWYIRGDDLPYRREIRRPEKKPIRIAFYGRIARDRLPKTRQRRLHLFR